MPERLTFDLTVAYNGTRFHGWQKQGEQPTVQLALEQALASLLGKPTGVAAASRTDAGVHARAQRVTFVTHEQLEPATVLAGLNRALPAGVVVRRVRRVPRWFHARGSLGKTYVYALSLGTGGPPRPAPRDPRAIWERDEAVAPWADRYTFALCAAPDRALLQEALGVFVGTHNFLAYATRTYDPARGECRIDEVRVEEAPLASGQLWLVTLRGNRFLRRMVRRLVGAALIAHRAPDAREQLAARLARPEPCYALDAAPGRGLCLMNVDYPDVANAPSASLGFRAQEEEDRSGRQERNLI